MLNSLLEEKKSYVAEIPLDGCRVVNGPCRLSRKRDWLCHGLDLKRSLERVGRY